MVLLFYDAFKKKRLQLFDGIKKNRHVLTIFSFLLLSQLAFGQATDGGAGALQDAADKIEGYIEPAFQMLYIIAAILGIIGIVVVYNKYNHGDNDAMKSAIRWFGGAIGVIVMAEVIKILFGVG